MFAGLSRRGNFNPCLAQAGDDDVLYSRHQNTYTRVSHKGGITLAVLGMLVTVA